MFKKDSQFTESEKINYIFTKTRKQSRNKMITNILKLAVFSGIVYFYMVIFPTLDIDKLAEEYIIPKMSKIVQMTAEKTMQNVNLSLPDGNSSDILIQSGAVLQNNKTNIPKVNITPEMIEAVRKSMNK
ncbi:MAG: hypothetical protein PHZ26_01490 [Candidatus Gracilibacteria bacterium]|nr:hypothetical protein [Candidatus Gracilibacteria bacterium]MDD2908407.1 hypothetical protein [Candidatus Gracilibacteria bacterium]